MDKTIPFTLTYNALKMFGRQLYSNPWSALSELVANGFDAVISKDSAIEVYLYIDISNKNSAVVEIFDNGTGMTEKDFEDKYVIIGRNRREKDSSGSAMGRKGIGKLAALYLSDNYTIISKKDNQLTAWNMSTKDVKEDENPSLKSLEIESIKIVCEDVWDKFQTGTLIQLKNVDLRRMGDATIEALGYKLSNNFLLDNTNKKLFINVSLDGRNPNRFRQINKNIAFCNMVQIYANDKKVINELDQNTYKLFFTNKKGESKSVEYDRKISNMPEQIEYQDRDKSEKETISLKGKRKFNDSEEEHDYELTGWIGVHSTIERTYAELNDSRYLKNQFFSPNQLRIYVRGKLATESILSKIGLSGTYERYLEGELSFDVLDDDQLEDIATTNRQDLVVDDRVELLIKLLRGLGRKLLVDRQNVADRLNEDIKKENKKIDDLETKAIQDKFIKGQVASRSIFYEKLDEEDRAKIEQDYTQLSRAVSLAGSTKKIFISHKADCAKFGEFLIDVLIAINPTLKSEIIFTSSPQYGVPHGEDIYEYLRKCFRDDLFVVFLFSKSFYDSDVCISEAGAAWATNKKYANIVIDVGFSDISKPINNAQSGAQFKLTNNSEKSSFVNTIHYILKVVDREYNKFDIEKIVDTVLSNYTSVPSLPFYQPFRKFQAAPICENCNNTMMLKNHLGSLMYFCNCGVSMKAKV